MDTPASLVQRRAVYPILVQWTEVVARRRADVLHTFCGLAAQPRRRLGSPRDTRTLAGLTLGVGDRAILGASVRR